MCRFSNATGLRSFPWSRSTPGGNLATCPVPLGIFRMTIEHRQPLLNETTTRFLSQAEDFE
jgi:hypothetical protein